MSHQSQIRLDELAIHKCAIVHHVEAQDDDLERLMAMGLCRGRAVELIQAGDPMILRVYGSRIGVSARLASRIIVAPCGPDCTCRESFHTS
jgi:Fe2+ transport system protein FeoA